MKLEVLVLEPDHSENDSYNCDFCNISYSKSDYETLYNSKKIIYLVVPYYLAFDFDNGAKESYSSSLDLCHSCFYNHLKNSSSNDDPIEITFLQQEKETVRFFDPSDDDSENSSFFFLPNG